MLTHHRGDVIAAARALAMTGQSTVLTHVVNDRGGWGRGFVLALSRVWPEPEERYRAWAAGQTRGPGLTLGVVQLVQVEPSLLVANCCAQAGYSTPGHPAFRPQAMGQCLSKLAARLPDHTFLMPRIGSGLGGYAWADVEPIVVSSLAGVKAIQVFIL